MLPLCHGFLGQNTSQLLRMYEGCVDRVEPDRWGEDDIKLNVPHDAQGSGQLNYWHKTLQDLD